MIISYEEKGATDNNLYKEVNEFYSEKLGNVLRWYLRILVPLSMRLLER